MRVSLFLPTIHEGRFIPIGALDARHVTMLADEAEALGYDGVWLGEFMDAQADVLAMHDRPPSYYAPLAVLGMLAERTSRLQLTTGVLVLPHHDALILARELATLDVLSGGRVRLGGGLGGSRDDFARLRKVVSGAGRATLLEETVLAMRRLWEEDPAAFHGEHVAFDGVRSYPKPVQTPLPVFLAGSVDAMLERIGRIADGWIDTFLPPAGMASRIVTMRRAAEAAGRDPDRLQVLRGFFCAIGDSDDEAERIRDGSVPDGQPTGPPNTDEREFLLVGSAKSIRNQLERFADVGIDEINLAFYHRTPEEAVRQAQLFAAEVMPFLRTDR